MSFSTANYSSPQGNTRLLSNVQRNSKYWIRRSLVEILCRLEGKLRTAIAIQHRVCKGDQVRGKGAQEGSAEVC